MKMYDERKKKDAETNQSEIKSKSNQISYKNLFNHTTIVHCNVMQAFKGNYSST